MGAAARGDKNPPKFLTAREVLEFATIEGARANGLERKIGTLTPGKDADIILLRTDRLNVMPMNNAVGAVVTSMGPQNVDTVLIAGKVMKRNGQLVGVDFDRLTRLGDQARDRALCQCQREQCAPLDCRTRRRTAHQQFDARRESAQLGLSRPMSRLREYHVASILDHRRPRQAEPDLCKRIAALRLK